MAEVMKFRCIMCFSMNDITRDMLGLQHACKNCGKVMQLPNSSFASGRVVGEDFVLKKKLGSGAMGSVFLAHQLSMDRDVALKILFYQYTKDEKYAEEFNREARAAARLNHINIVQSLAFGMDGDILYTAMHYIDGMTLDKVLKMRRKYPLDDALNIAQQVAEGLHYGWSEMQLIHRDIKPGNLIVTKDGIAKITDFGLARTASEVPTDIVSGTPAYMSPEQFTRRELDCRSDIYSLGITLFELLSGELPFKGQTASEVAKRHLTEPLPIGRVKPALPRKVKTLLRKMTAKNPADRFQTYEELLTSLVSIRKRVALDKESVSSVHTMSFERHDLIGSDRGGPIKTLAEVNAEERSREEKVSERKFHKTIMVLGSTVVFLLFLSLFLGSGGGRSKGDDLAAVQTELLKMSENQAKFTEHITDLINVNRLNYEAVIHKLNANTPEATLAQLQTLSEQLKASELEDTKAQTRFQKNVEHELLSLKSQLATLAGAEKQSVGRDFDKECQYVDYRLINYLMAGNVAGANYTLQSYLRLWEEPAMREWLKSRLAVITGFDELLLQLTTRAASEEGLVIGAGRVVVPLVSLDSIRLKNEAGAETTVMLDQLPLSELLALFDDNQEALLEFMYYKGRFSRVLELAPNDEQWKARMHGVIEAGLQDLESCRQAYGGSHLITLQRKSRLRKIARDTEWSRLF